MAIKFRFINKKPAVLLFFLPLWVFSQPFAKKEIQGWQQQAMRVSIVRDNWGIPHIYGKSDADAVFGLLYAQCEDDFKRVEMNYIEKLGRRSELKGESALYDDLYLRLIIDSADAILDYRRSAPWLRKLLNAYADGINYYLFTHPSVKPALLQRFQPWYPLLWTDGSIGAISTGDITAGDVKNYFSGDGAAAARAATPSIERNTGSNGFAIAPARTVSGNSILFINPHVSFYFRPEVHVVSEEGLNVYGAVTWGQFFVYQGFNENCGWMHTSSDVDVADLYEEKLVQRRGGLFYRYDGKLLAVRKKIIRISVRQEDAMVAKKFTANFTYHGPVMARRSGKYLSVRSYNRAMASLVQSWQRTKAGGFEQFKKTMELRANTSNNTVFADNKGNIAYWHGDFVPRRASSLNWDMPVDGSDPATEWKGLHTLEEIVHVYNPASGWIQNCNSTPFTVAGASSPARADYPLYMAPDGENFRGITAARLLGRENAFTIDKVISAGYDTYLSAFEVLVPALVAAYERAHGDSGMAALAAPVELLKTWDYRSGEQSVATTVAVEWAERLSEDIRKVYIRAREADQVTATRRFAAAATPGELLHPLQQVIAGLVARFGNWQVPWGEINRYQRNSSDIDQQYDDQKNSVPVGYAPSAWGMLPAYNSRYFAGTRKRYGVSGNSFICAVEFGKKVKAKALLAGGESADPASTHFNDQLGMYATGKFREVLFYKEDVMKHAESTYHPGNKF
jgi:acyl-homoserine-lactone acylase